MMAQADEIAGGRSTVYHERLMIITKREQTARAGGLWLIWLVALVFALMGCGRKEGQQSGRQVSGEIVDAFYVGVASLDVEENERASTLFADLSKKLEDEPAVWANLGVVRLRLGDVAAAEQALTTAAKLAPGNRQITVAQAIVEERQGKFANAIERLRGLIGIERER